MTALDYSIGQGAGRGEVAAGKGAARAGTAPGAPADGADGAAGQGFAAVFKQMAAPAQEAPDTGAGGRENARPGAKPHDGEGGTRPAPDEPAHDGPAPAGERQARPGRAAATHGPGSLSQLLLALGRPARAPALSEPGDPDTADDPAATSVQAAPDGAGLQASAMGRDPMRLPELVAVQDPALGEPSANPLDPSQSSPSSSKEDNAVARGASSGAGDPTAPGGSHAPTRAEQDAAAAAFALALGRADASAGVVPTAQSEAGARSDADQTAGSAFSDEAGVDAARPIQVSVISRETHFAPIRSLTGQALPFAQAGGAGLPAGAVSGVPSGPPPLAPQAPPPVGAGPVPLSTYRATLAQPATAGAASAPIAPRGDIAARERPASASGRQPLAARVADAGHRTKDEAVAPADPIQDAHALHREEREASAEGRSPEPLPGPQSAATAPVLAAAGLSALAEMPTVRQVAEAISNEMSSLGAPDVPGEDARSLAGPVRVLEIQLHPDDLGTVNVRLRLTPQGLEVRLRASNSDTARMLEQDRAALGEILRSAGYQPGDIQILTTDGSGFTGLTGHEPTPFAAAQPSAPEERGSERQPGGGSGRQPSDSSEQKGARRDETGDRDSFGRGDFSR
ncbi:flagellar hook-length control protein FliK [Roseixanthobacter glucoisosaccharinicivorans]|uniref:flagellar hook-length control protein FliK n=1 Tax=Roseixanthobacter glucoisosaccharinicivorans TaxID=3119923 RepID=UPI003729E5E7